MKSIKTMILGVVAVVAAIALFVAATPNKKNVLIIGDSISIGYTPFVIKELADEANVVRIKGNAGDTNNGLKKIDEWLGDVKWDVIHFNFGLHDLCYRHPDSKNSGMRDKVAGTQSVPIDKYEKNLQEIVDRLKSTGAKLIFATTTYVPDQEVGRIMGDEIVYNKVAVKVMKRNNIAINPLYDISQQTHLNYGRGVWNVHYKAEGSKIYADKVVAAIREML